MGAESADSIDVSVSGGGSGKTAVEWTEMKAAAVNKEWDRVIKDFNQVQSRSTGEKLGGILTGCGIFLVLTIVLVVVYAVEGDGAKPGSAFGGGILALCIIIATLFVCAVPCLCGAGHAPRRSTVPKSVPRSVGSRAAADGETLPYRSTRTVELESTIPDADGSPCSTLREVWDMSVRRFGDAACLGEREVLDTYTQMVEVANAEGVMEKRPFVRKVMAPEFSFWSFKETNERVEKYARALSGLVAKHKGEFPGHAGIFSSTRRGWQLTAQACFRAGIPLATVYHTLGPDGLAYAAFKTRVSVLIVEDTTLPMLGRVIGGMDVESGKVDADGKPETIRADLSSVKCVISLDAVSDDAASAASAAAGGAAGPIKTASDAVRALKDRGDGEGGPVEVLFVDDVVESGAKAVEEAEAPKPEDLAVIMFTSGSTGLPKGVEVLHRNLVAGARGIGMSLPHMTTTDTYLAYLPLSHILELCAEICVLHQGTSIGYGSVYTLTASSPMVPQPSDDLFSEKVPGGESVPGDAVALAPTVMAAVPAIVTRIQKGLSAQVAKMRVTRKLLINAAISSGIEHYREGRTAPFFEGVVLDKLRAQVLGGRVRAMASGGGPLTGAAQEWMSSTMRAPLRQGYGLTETCGCGTLQWGDSLKVVNVGPPLPTCDIKLVDWAEGGYLSTDNPPRGEVCISGANVVKGYYEEPEKTAEAFREDEDGRIWFHTGDIGAFDADGELSIIDRKKDLLKLSGGEYISLGKMEAIYTQIPCIQNALCFGKSTESYSVAAVIIDPTNLPDDLKRDGEKAYVGDTDVAAYCLEQMRGVMKTKSKNKGEAITKVYVVGSTFWLPASGLVTASMKIQRKKATDYYKKVFDFMYGHGSNPKEEVQGAVPASL